jgi:glycosyltransferase involved in cell wall biosynthesis
MTGVLHVITGLGVGGAEAMLVQIAAALQRRGIAQHVVGLTGLDARAADLRASGIDVTVLGMASPASLLAAVPVLRRTVKRVRPRVIQGWMYHGNIAASLCHYACGGRRGRKLFWNLRASNMDSARYGAVIRCGSLLSRGVDVVVSNSEAGIAFHRGHGFRSKQFEVIDNGIDTDRFRPDAAMRKQVRAELDIPGDKAVVVNVARVDPMKDHATFLAAMAQVPDAVGLLVGMGTTELPLPPNVRALGLRRDVDRLLTAGDIVASTSAFGEGFSNAVAEGMSAGLVPVVTDVGDARRIVGDTGGVVPAGDVAAVARAIAKEVAISAEERSARAGRARARIVENFSLARAADRYQRLYAA